MREDQQTIIRYRVQCSSGGVWWHVRSDPYDTLQDAKNAMRAQVFKHGRPVRIVREKVEFEVVEEQ